MGEALILVFEMMIDDGLRNMILFYPVTVWSHAGCQLQISRAMFSAYADTHFCSLITHPA